MSARIFATSTPTQRGMWNAPIHPMSAEDSRFWRIRRERKAQETSDERAVR